MSSSGVCRMDMLDAPTLFPKKRSSEALQVRVAPAFAASGVSRQEWDDALVRLGGSIYMSYDCVKTWWEFYGEGKSLRIFIFSVADEIVGILPIYIECLRLWPLRFIVARLVGANIPPKVFDPPLHRAWAVPIFEQVIAHLITKDGCDAFSLGPVSETCVSSDLMSKVRLEESNLVSRLLESSAGVHSVWALPPSLEQYYASLSRNERKNRKSDFKQLQNEYGARVEVVRDPQGVEAAFEAFVQQHAAQWRFEGKAGHFGAWPQALEFNRALVRAHGRLGRVRFIRILARDQVIASLYAFAFGGCYYCELPARSTDPEWSQFSLGPAGIVATIDAAIREGITTMEGGLAHYDYKLRLGAKDYATRTFRIMAKPGRSRVRAWVFNTLRFCLHNIYHKVWYRRITPFLPAGFRKPLWRLWLRFDF